MIDVKAITELAKEALSPEEIQVMKDQMIAQAAKTLNQNQECYVAQWILHNPDENFKDWMLVNEWRQDGFGYNFYMVRRENVNV